MEKRNKYTGSFILIILLYRVTFSFLHECKLSCFFRIFCCYMREKTAWNNKKIVVRIIVSAFDAKKFGHHYNIIYIC